MNLYCTKSSRVTEEDKSVDCFMPCTLLQYTCKYCATGNLLATLFPWPSPRWYWPLCHVRTLLALPFFLMCNVLPDSRVLPVWFGNDWLFILGQVLFAYTNGHLASLAVMYNPRCAPPPARPAAHFSTRTRIRSDIISVLRECAFLCCVVYARTSTCMRVLSTVLYMRARQIVIP